MFQHSNIYLKLGWLNYVFSIFGTFFYPKEREVQKIGLYNPAYPKDYVGQLKAPFQGNIDKPIDFYEREEYYHELVNSEQKPTGEKELHK
ncbi:MAG: hypothetical protein AB8B69_14180 [Chitinophagales bacterium]